MNVKARFFAFLLGIALILVSLFSSGCAHRPFASEEIWAGPGEIGMTIECLEGGRLYVPAVGARHMVGCFFANLKSFFLNPER